jgi:hypothetical protein
MNAGEGRDVPLTAGLADACSAQTWKLPAIAGNAPTDA